MNEVNQLILDCLARVLRINETTDADISFNLLGAANAIQCYGYKSGFANSVAEQGENPNIDFAPISQLVSIKSPYEYIFLNFDGAEDMLKKLLSSLDALEKELIQSA